MVTKASTAVSQITVWILTYNWHLAMVDAECSAAKKRVFLCLILAQGAHLVEECVTKLYEVFAPARLVAGLMSHDLGLRSMTRLSKRRQSGWGVSGEVGEACLAPTEVP